MTTDIAVALDGLTRTYRSRAGDVHALRGVTHLFRTGDVHGGDGTVRLRQVDAAAARRRARPADAAAASSSGARPLDSMNQTALTRFRRTSMAFVFQAYNLLDALTAYDNVALPARLAGEPVDRRAVLDALDRVGLRDLAKRRPPELSGGQQQRVAIARALHSRPEVLFADEPTGALDRRAGRDVLALLRDVADGGQTVVMVTHDPLAASYADEVLFLADGAVVGRLRHADATRIAAAMSELEQ